MNPDKPLPQNKEAEDAIIGTCLVYADSILNVSSVITAEMFYDEGNKKIYTAMTEVLKKKGNCDLISVTDYLRINGQLESVGGVLSLTKRTMNVYSDANILQYAFMVREKYVLRQYIFAGHKLANMSYIEDLEQVVEYAETSLFEISNFTQAKEPKRIDRCVDEYLIEVNKIINKEKSLSGIGSGLTTLDRVTGGWQPSDLIIVAGRPSMGKTALALSLVKGTAELSVPVAIFSLEMSESQLTGRYLSCVSGRSNMEIRTGHVDIDLLAEQSNEVAMLPIFIDDTPALSIFELRSKVKKLVVREGIKMIVIDYLQLMSSEAGSREQEISKISRGLKVIAKEFNIPVIALSQLNRGVEDRADKKPRLSDLRESGAIEQDADVVIMIHRPAVYGLRTAMIGFDEVSSDKLLVVDIAKHRNGPVLTMPLYHNDSLTKITDEEPNITDLNYQP